jgi:hypothetical protein
LALVPLGTQHAPRNALAHPHAKGPVMNEGIFILNAHFPDDFGNTYVLYQRGPMGGYFSWSEQLLFARMHFYGCP